MKTQFIRNLMLSVGLILSGTIYGQDAGELNVPLSNPGKRGKLLVDMNYGSLTVRGTSVNEVIISYTVPEKKVKDKSKSESSGNGLRKLSGTSLDLEASEQNNTVEVDSDSWNKRIDLDIQVPANFDLYLETYNSGNIYVSNITGEVEADSYNGKITLENISGTVVADTYNGAIRVTFDSVTPDKPMAFSTYNGHVDLSFPQNYKASFKMKARNGDIYEGFDMILEKAEPKTETKRESGTYKVKIDDWLRGSINGGGPEISMQTTNGNIYIRKK